MQHLGCSAIKMKQRLLEQGNEAELPEAEPRRTAKEQCHADACTFLDALTKIEARTVHSKAMKLFRL